MRSGAATWCRSCRCRCCCNERRTAVPKGIARLLGGPVRSVEGCTSEVRAMKVQVRYFASLREALGASESVDLATGATLGGLRDALIARGGEYARCLARGRAVRCALDQ